MTSKRRRSSLRRNASCTRLRSLISFSSSVGLRKASALGTSGTSATAVTTETLAVSSFTSPENRYIGGVGGPHSNKGGVAEADNEAPEQQEHQGKRQIAAAAHKIDEDAGDGHESEPDKPVRNVGEQN